MSSPSQPNYAAEAVRAREILEQGDFENGELPGTLKKAEEDAEQGSIARDTRDYDPYDVWNDLAENTKSVRSALDHYLAEHAPPASTAPDQGESATEKKLKEKARVFSEALDDAIASGE
ncbi:MAG: hypothetical protein ACLQBY_02575 [Solirubrobacteraceae bacterium]